MDTDDYAALRGGLHQHKLWSMYGPTPAALRPVRVKKIGSREEVWGGKAQQTKGGLRKDDLVSKVTKVGPNGTAYTKLVSRKASEAAQRKSNLPAYSLSDKK